MDITNQINQNSGVSAYLHNLMINPLGSLLQEVNSTHSGDMGEDLMNRLALLIQNGPAERRIAIETRVEFQTQEIAQCMQRAQALMNAAAQGADSPQVTLLLSQLREDSHSMNQARVEVGRLVTAYLFPSIKIHTAQPANVLPPAMPVSEDINAALPG
ncbi:MAG: hypothetical protein S4CHLAM20_00970 [Chlamydiia bacterium]|nr:hypothetical protein [Chlamydiia bacterium]